MIRPVVGATGGRAARGRAARRASLAAVIVADVVVRPVVGPAAAAATAVLAASPTDDLAGGRHLGLLADAGGGDEVELEDRPGVLLLLLDLAEGGAGELGVEGRQDVGRDV